LDGNTKLNPSSSKSLFETSPWEISYITVELFWVVMSIASMRGGKRRLSKSPGLCGLSGAVYQVG